MYSISSLFWIYQNRHLKYIRAARIWKLSTSRKHSKNCRWKFERGREQFNPQNLKFNTSKQPILSGVHASERVHEQFDCQNLKFQVEIHVCIFITNQLYNYYFLNKLKYSYNSALLVWKMKELSENKNSGKLNWHELDFKQAKFESCWIMRSENGTLMFVLILLILLLILLKLVFTLRFQQATNQPSQTPSDHSK